MGREDASLRGAGDRVPLDAILTEDARFEERRDQGQYALVPDASPHPAHETDVGDFIERSPVLLPVSRTCRRR